MEVYIFECGGRRKQLKARILFYFFIPLVRSCCVYVCVLYVALLVLLCVFLFFHFFFHFFFLSRV